MYQGQIRGIVALIILFGHLAVFFAGLLLGTFGPLTGTDAAQTVLIASPVLAVSGTAALMWIIRGQTGITKGEKVSGIFSVVSIFFPIALLVCIFFIFIAVYKQAPGFGSEQMKIALGGVETFFGVYLGAISDTLFGTHVAAE
jgi:uncharacterized BrkB/YihY/UPF0761 family membrane protein